MKNGMNWRNAKEEKPPVGELVLALYNGYDPSVVYWGSDDKWHEQDGEEVNYISMALKNYGEH